MPNIMMFGFSPEQYRVKKKIIDAVMQKLGLGDDAVTTWIKDSLVISCDGQHKSMPYIRICCTDAGQGDYIRQCLQAANLDLDCEQLPIRRFFEAKTMRVDSD